MITSIEKQKILSDINNLGYSVVENLISDSVITNVKSELRKAIDEEAKFHGSKDFKDYGMLLACPIYGGAFLDILEEKAIFQPFDWILGEDNIIYVYTSSSMPPKGTNYSQRIHVDRPHFIPGYIEAMGCLILLDDFTEENGATWVLPGSHLKIEQPSEKEFYNNAKRIIAPKGSVFYFNLRLWHTGGVNRTNQWRHSLGIGMIRPYLKQRIDLPRAIDNKNIDISHLSDFAMQKLGYFSQPPTSLDEFYAPSSEKSYKQKSEWAK